jgi:hypothetical protein
MNQQMKIRIIHNRNQTGTNIFEVLKSFSNPEKEQNEMFEALLMPFLDPLLGAPHGLLDVMKKVLEFFLEHYEMRWTADIKDVCSDVVKQQIPLSTKVRV